MNFPVPAVAELIQVLEAMKNRRDVSVYVVVTSGLNSVLGELPAAATLAYTGALEDGDVKAFARRVEELFGSNAPMVASSLVEYTRMKSPVR